MIKLLDQVIANPATGFVLASGVCRYTHAYVVSLEPLILISEMGDMKWSSVDLEDIQTVKSFLSYSELPVGVLDRMKRSAIEFADANSMETERIDTKLEVNKELVEALNQHSDFNPLATVRAIEKFPEINPELEVKQLIILRTDLKNTKGEKVRTGKLMAQVCHASLSSHELSSPAHRTIWSKYCNHKKIVLKINSEEELLELNQQLKEAGLHTALIQDLGLTEFKEPTYTCLGVLDLSERLDTYTKHLSLY